MSQTTLDIKEPGLNVLPPGVERHIVNAGGLTGLQIHPDDEIEIIKVCIEYSNNEPIYMEFDGWLSSTEGITEYSNLPLKARTYIEYIEDFIECSASIISTGPSREQTILRST